MKRFIETVIMIALLGVAGVVNAQAVPSYDEDTPAVSGDKGIQGLTVRKDTAAATAGTDGDYQPLTTDASGKLWVNAAGTGAAGDITKAEDAAHASGHAGVMSLIVRDDALVSGNDAADADYVPAKSDLYGALWTHPLTKTTTLTDTAVIEAAAYASGDCIMASAEVMTGDANVDPFLSGRITDIVITDLAAQAANIDVVFFNADPGAVCAAINAATDIADDDLAKVIGIVPVTTHFALNDNSVSTATNVNIKYNLAADTGLYYALISRGTPTYGGTSDLVVSVKVELD